MRHILPMLLILCLLVPLPAAATPPNIVFILADDMRFDCLHAAGNPGVLTPNLDRLWEQGLVFRQSTSSCPLCCPTRSILLTGVPPWINGHLDNPGVTENFAPHKGYKLPTTLPRLLVGAGYETVLCGKHHVNPWPWTVGFTNIQHWAEGGYFNSYVDQKLAFGNSTTKTLVPGYLAEIYASDAVNFIQGPHAQPYFLWLAFNQPHWPHKPWPARIADLYPLATYPAPPGFPPGTVANIGWRNYYRSITHMDEQIGRVLDALASTGQDANTIVIFATEQGLMCGSHAVKAKRAAYDESWRSTVIVRGPGVLARTSTEQIDYYDLSRTMAEIGGATVPNNWKGRSLMPELAGSPVGAEIAVGVHMIAAEGVSPWRAVRTQTDKLIISRDSVTGALTYELYDLLLDPLELVNEAENPLYLGTRTARLAQLKQWQLETGDPATWP